MAEDFILRQNGQEFQALVDAILPPVQVSQPASGMLPNVVYDLGTLSNDTTFTFAQETQGIVNHYYWTFQTGSTVPSFTFPASITSWIGGSAPTLSANKHYEFSVIDGVAIFIEV